MGGKVLRQALEQRVLRGLRLQFQFDRAGLAAGRVVGHLATQRMCQQLMAVADAEYRQVVVGGLAQPRGAALAPVGMVGDEGGRAGHQHAGEGMRVGQGATVLDIDHHRLVFFQPGGDADPVRKRP